MVETQRGRQAGSGSPILGPFDGIGNFAGYPLRSPVRGRSLSIVTAPGGSEVAGGGIGEGGPTRFCTSTFRRNRQCGRYCGTGRRASRRSAADIASRGVERAASTKWTPQPRRGGFGRRGQHACVEPDEGYAPVASFDDSPIVLIYFNFPISSSFQLSNHRQTGAFCRSCLRAARTRVPTPPQLGRERPVKLRLQDSQQEEPREKAEAEALLRRTAPLQ